MPGMTASRILAHALRQPERERARLAESLIASLDGARDDDAEAAWQAEIQRRLHEVEAGTVRCRSWAVVRRRLRARLDAAP